MKASEPREREFKRLNRDQATGRHNPRPGEFWDGVSGVYTVRPRPAAAGDTATHPEHTHDQVVGVMCEPTN